AGQGQDPGRAAAVALERRSVEQGFLEGPGPRSREGRRPGAGCDRLRAATLDDHGSGRAGPADTDRRADQRYIGRDDRTALRAPAAGSGARRARGACAVSGAGLGREAPSLEAAACDWRGALVTVRWIGSGEAPMERFAVF